MKRLTYAEAGVDRKIRANAKKHLANLSSTHSFSKYGKVIETPYNNLYPIGKDRYQVKTCDGVGTKVLLAELANKHDTIGIDAIAMVVNDCIRCGATPIAVTDVIDIRKSEPSLLSQLERGLREGATQASTPLIGGETADVPELLNATYHINCDCVGEILKKDLISGKGIKPGDLIIGLKSSGVHSNGISLVRRVLFKKWGGAFEPFFQPNELNQEVVFEALQPTSIYVKQILRIVEQFSVLGAVHITGDAYLKFDKLWKSSPKIGFEFDNFKPQPIFELIQRTGNVSLKEMFSTFNMGWGFALITKKEDVDGVLSMLHKEKVDSEVIGKITDSNHIVVKHRNEKIILE